jgi:NADH-quinone oxidoreductase subunit G
VGDDEARGGLDEVAGHAGVVLVLGDELLDQDASFGADAELYVHLGAHPCAAAAHAQFVLPLTTHAEQEGTFTNHEGRVQRFWPALQAPGAARPAWLVLGALLAELSGVEPPTSASAAFAALVAPRGAFEGLDYATIGTRGAVVNEPASLAGD